MNRVLVLSPHPDDEAIGCGGTLRKHVTRGDDVRAIFLTSGENGGHGRPPAETAQVREAEATAAAAVLGLAGIEFWRLPDGKFAATAALAGRLRDVLVATRPALVYVPHDREMHPDHRAAVDLIRAAVADLSPSDRPEVLMFEVWTPLETFDLIEDITVFVSVKADAIRAHASQCSIIQFDEAALGLNRYRGEMHCWPEGEYAEVFRRLS